MDTKPGEKADEKQDTVGSLYPQVLHLQDLTNLKLKKKFLNSRKFQKAQLEVVAFGNYLHGIPIVLGKVSNL